MFWKDFWLHIQSLRSYSRGQTSLWCGRMKIRSGASMNRDGCDFWNLVKGQRLSEGNWAKLEEKRYPLSRLPTQLTPLVTTLRNCRLLQIFFSKCYLKSVYFDNNAEQISRPCRLNTELLNNERAVYQGRI